MKKRRRRFIGRTVEVGEWPDDTRAALHPE
jgi:hypothetical protein